MIPLLAAFVLPFLRQSPSAGIEFQDFQGDPGFVAKVDGKPRTLVLCTRWPASYMLGGDNKPHNVSLDGKTVIQAKFAKTDKATMFPNAQGVLGIDALRKACFGFDVLWNRVEPIAKTKIGMEGAKAYFAKMPAWNGPMKIVKVPLGRTIKGIPTIRVTVGGVSTTLILTFSPYNNMIDKTVKNLPIAKDGDWSYIPKLMLPGLPSAWVTYATLSEWDAREEGGHGILALDAFESRRVLVDLADDALYIEELSDDARLSIFLSRTMSMTYVISGDKIMIDALPGLYDEDKVGPMTGSRIVRLAGDPVADWLKDLRSGDPEAVLRLIKRFKRTEEDDYEVDLVDPEGTTRTVTIPVRERPGDTFALRNR